MIQTKYNNEYMLKINEHSCVVLISCFSLPVSVTQVENSPSKHVALTSAFIFRIDTFSLLGARKAIRDRRINVEKTDRAGGGGTLRVHIKALQCEDAGVYQCSVDSYDMWPVTTEISIISKCRWTPVIAPTDISSLSE